MSLIRIDESGQEITPELLRERGMHGSRIGALALQAGDENGPELARRAIADLVEGFLLDRLGNADLFTVAHRLGALLSATVECLWTPGEDFYTLSCPIYALHQRWATSVAMTVLTHCSICGAGELECDHLPGESYDGNPCYSVVDSIGPFGHVAFTANPDFTYTWYREQRYATAELIADGIITSVGDEATCTHCPKCSGINGPSPGDLDPVGRFQELIDSARDLHAGDHGHSIV